MTVDDHKLNQVVATITAAGPDAARSLENTAPVHGVRPRLW